MRGLRGVFRHLALMLLLLSLGSAPAANAMTHVPGTLAAEAAHAEWHAEKGEVWQADGHQNHDATDHDLLTLIILSSHGNATFGLKAAIELQDLPALAEAICDGPRRPPRDGL